MAARPRWKFAKFLVGLLLLPVAAALTLTFWRSLLILAEAPTRLPILHVGATVAGIAIWALVWTFLPPMTKTYVLGHELTHALWTLLFGGRPSKLRVGDAGGSVCVSKTNVWVSLSPYFFPFYTVLVLAIWGTVRTLCPAARPYDPIAIFWVGLTWAFHLTFTIRFLRGGQPDVQEHGAFFSLVLIYTLNLLTLTCALVAISTWTFPSAARDFCAHLAYFAHLAAEFRDWLLTRLPAPRP